MFGDKKYLKKNFVIIHKKRILDRHIVKLKEYLPLTDDNCKIEYKVDKNAICSLGYKLYNGYLDLFDLKVYKTIDNIDENNDYIIINTEQLYRENNGKVSIKDAISEYNYLSNISDFLDEINIKRIDKMVKVKSKHG